MTEQPFNMLIVGPTYCGKTYYLLEMLERDYKKVFDHIILICPTILRNKTYRKWKYFHDSDLIVLPVKHDEVDQTLQYVIDTYKGDPNEDEEVKERNLIILDDCASGQDVKNRTSKLVELAMSLSVDRVKSESESNPSPSQMSESRKIC